MAVINWSIAELNQILETNANMLSTYEQSVADFESAFDTVKAKLTERGLDTSTATTFADLMALIDEISIFERIVETEIIGNYATSSYYNVDFGMKISYAANGDVFLTMQGSNNPSYENLYFDTLIAPDGVTMKKPPTTPTTSSTLQDFFTCYFTGLNNGNKTYKISADLYGLVGGNDSVAIKITITEVA